MVAIGIFAYIKLLLRWRLVVVSHGWVVVFERSDYVGGITQGIKARLKVLVQAHCVDNM
ncbi:hypothetical protein HPP92_023015 [Vanilla planifolia]|uniref:Uncharacterized protein n=1 Tax=Vanilla planifolia TaxID=51239 RepID=A0A835PYL9_VANPL|nr:hypothetical protein HPP92_023015 [Vanilla planifolia]